MSTREEKIEAARESVECSKIPGGLPYTLFCIREALRNVCEVLEGDAPEPTVSVLSMDAIREAVERGNRERFGGAETGYPPEKVRELLDAIASNRWHAIFDLAAELRATEGK